MKFGILPNSWRAAGGFLIGLLLVWSAYSNTFSSPPALDDFHTFVSDGTLEGAAASNTDDFAYLRTHFSWSRLVPALTLTWDHGVGKGEVVRLHLTNLAIHSFCFLAVFLLMFQIAETTVMLSPGRQILPSPSWMPALWVATIWAVNPIQVNAVTYIAQRIAALVALFYVLSVAAFVAARLLHRREGRANAGVVSLYLLSFLGTVLAALSKENWVMLPFMLLITEAWFFDRSVLSRLARFLLKHYVFSLGALVVGVALAVRLLPPILSGYETRSFTLPERLLTEARVVVWYISIFFFPAPGRLSLEHDVDVSTSLFHPATTLPAILFLVGAVVAAILLRKRFPLATYGILWFFINLAVESTVIPLELVFEHRLYLPSVGLTMSTVVVLNGLFDRVLGPRLQAKETTRVKWCVFALLAACLALTTFYRNEAWRDALTLNRDIVSKAPLHPRSHANLAVALMRQKRYGAAIEEARQAIRLGRENFEQYLVAANTIVLCEFRLGRIDEAIADAEAFLRSVPPNGNVQPVPMIYYNLCSFYLAKHALPEAMRALKKAVESNLYLTDKVIDLRLGGLCATGMENILELARPLDLDLDGDGKPDPGYLSPAAWVGRFLLDVGDRAAGESFLADRTAAHPGDLDAVLLLDAARKWDEAGLVQREKWEFHRKYLSYPFSSFDLNVAVALLVCEYNLPAPFFGLGEWRLDKALALRPDSSDAHLLKGWYHHAGGRFPEALAEGMRAVKLDPLSAKAWLGVGFFQNSLNQREEALSAFRKVLELYPGCPERNAVRGIIKDIEAELVNN